jgi:hypothetical protein
VPYIECLQEDRLEESAIAATKCDI